MACGGTDWGRRERARLDRQPGHQFRTYTAVIQRSTGFAHIWLRLTAGRNSSRVQAPPQGTRLEVTRCRCAGRTSVTMQAIEPVGNGHTTA